MNARTAVAERNTDFAAPALAPPKPTPLAVVPPPQEAKAYPPKLAKALLAITRKFGAIKKDGWNKFHEYGYQKWEDILERESVLLAEHNIILQQSEVARSLLDKLISISYEFTIINEDGEVWPDKPVFTAIARLQDSKGIFDDKAANKCHTQAHKYFLINEFKIRTKEAAEYDADAGDEVPPKQIVKPPKPGSAEAKALEGPREIVAQGHNAQSWATTFIEAVNNRAASDAEIDQWIAANKNNLDRLEQYPDEIKRVNETVELRRKALAPKPVKPPKPKKAKAEKAEPKPNPMPDPANGETFIAWLKEKFAAFEKYEDGEKYWNETIEALDLSRDVQEEAMGVWRTFEARFEP